MSVTKVLTGHTSPETAYVVEDYPYGFRLRCKIRYWLDTNNRGTRVLSQTTNPKRPGTVWNKPKASTYSNVRVLFLDENGHVQNDGLSVYADTAKITAFEATFGAALTDSDQAAVSALKRVAARMDAREAARKAVCVSCGETGVVVGRPVCAGCWAESGGTAGPYATAAEREAVKGVQS